jgi:hypothetical protein
VLREDGTETRPEPSTTEKTAPETVVVHPPSVSAVPRPLGTVLA